MARRGFIWESTEDGPGALRLGVEKDEDYPCLKDHIPGPLLRDVLDQWKYESAGYLTACRQLVEVIVKKATDSMEMARILTQDEWPQEGVFWNMVDLVYSHHALLAQHPGGGGESHRRYEFSTTTSRVRGQGMLQVLMHGGAGIACYPSRERLEEWQASYQRLLDDQDLADAARQLVTLHKAVEQGAEAIRDVVHQEARKGTFDRGQCDLCS